MESKEIVAKIGEVIGKAAEFRNAYFFTSPGNAAGRRSYERKNSIPMAEWSENGHTYTAEFSVSCSCANVYASGKYTKDGNRTTLTAIKNSYRRMAAALEA